MAVEFCFKETPTIYAGGTLCEFRVKAREAGGDVFHDDPQGHYHQGDANPDGEGAEQQALPGARMFVRGRAVQSGIAVELEDVALVAAF